MIPALDGGVIMKLVCDELLELGLNETRKLER